jgi:hypothetical protein
MSDTIPQKYQDYPSLAPRRNAVKQFFAALLLALGSWTI